MLQHLVSHVAHVNAPSGVGVGATRIRGAFLARCRFKQNAFCFSAATSGESSIVGKSSNFSIPWPSRAPTLFHARARGNAGASDGINSGGVSVFVRCYLRNGRAQFDSFAHLLQGSVRVSICFCCRAFMAFCSLQQTQLYPLLFGALSGTR